MKKPRKPKPIAYELLDAAEHTVLYRLLARLIVKHHPELSQARIALAWCSSWKADADGRVTLGRCKRASDLDRELAAFDFVILLQKAFMTSLEVTDAQREALLDHELCHAEVRCDPRTAEPLEDERGRQLYRLRKHDIEEFGEIVERHGCYKADLERFAQSLLRSKQIDLPIAEPKARTASGSAMARRAAPGTH